MNLQSLLEKQERLEKDKKVLDAELESVKKEIETTQAELIEEDKLKNWFRHAELCKTQVSCYYSDSDHFTLSPASGKIFSTDKEDLYIDGVLDITETILKLETSRDGIRSYYLNYPELKKMQEFINKAVKYFESED